MLSVIGHDSNSIHPRNCENHLQPLDHSIHWFTLAKTKASISEAVARICKLTPTYNEAAIMAEHPSEIYLGLSPRSPTAPHRWPPESEERRSRAPEFYGFVAWTSTYLLFVLYILWAILPEQYIERIGIIWYPSRYVGCGFSFFFRIL